MVILKAYVSSLNKAPTMTEGCMGMWLSVTSMLCCELHWAKKKKGTVSFIYEPENIAMHLLTERTIDNQNSPSLNWQWPASNPSTMPYHYLSTPFQLAPLSPFTKALATKFKRRPPETNPTYFSFSLWKETINWWKFCFLRCHVCLPKMWHFVTADWEGVMRQW